MGHYFSHTVKKVELGLCRGKIVRLTLTNIYTTMTLLKKTKKINGECFMKYLIKLNIVQKNYNIIYSHLIYNTNQHILHNSELI